jgi:hypothetical protein
LPDLLRLTGPSAGRPGSSAAANPDAVHHHGPADHGRLADDDRSAGSGAAGPNDAAGANDRAGFAGFKSHGGGKGQHSGCYQQERTHVGLPDWYWLIFRL